MLITNWKQFAKATIETHDLDPTYDFLYAARKELGNEWATRFVLNYLCFYDMGGAVACAQQTRDHNFWDYIIENYRHFPRGTERRHTRGEPGLNYIKHLAAKGSPYEIWARMYAPDYTGLIKVFKTDFTHCGFGPYFVWKVMDLQDRVFERYIHLSLIEAVRHCPDEPRKAAKILWPDMNFRDVMYMIMCYIRQFPAPGEPGMFCSYAEAETILCMLKGWGITKTHVIGDDIDSKYEQLRKWPGFHKFLPEKVNKDDYARPATLDAATLSADGA